MEKNTTSIVQAEKVILQWIRKAELDLTFAEEIYSAEQRAHAKNHDVKLPMV